MNKLNSSPNGATYVIPSGLNLFFLTSLRVSPSAENMSSLRDFSTSPILPHLLMWAGFFFDFVLLHLKEGNSRNAVGQSWAEFSDEWKIFWFFWAVFYFNKKRKEGGNAYLPVEHILVVFQRFRVYHKPSLLVIFISAILLYSKSLYLSNFWGHFY